MNRRISQLEAACKVRHTICPSVKRWLGIQLSPEEEVIADRVDAVREQYDPSKVDLSDLSKEAQEWLRV